MRKSFYLATFAAVILCAMAVLTSCGQDIAQNKIPPSDNLDIMNLKMNVQIGAYIFTATLEETEAAQEFVEMMKDEPIVVRMNDYSGFEKVGALGRNLTTSDVQTTTAPGDIVLYDGSNLVLFYDSNSWNYTRIGKIDDLTDWTKTLSSGDITATFSLDLKD